MIGQCRGMNRWLLCYVIDRGTHLVIQCTVLVDGMPSCLRLWIHQSAVCIATVISGSISDAEMVEAGEQ